LITGSILYRSREDLEATRLPMSAIIQVPGSMFRKKGNGKLEMLPRPGIHTSPDAFIHAMPAADLPWVSGYPSNPARGLFYIDHGDDHCP
jgi:ornithine cyclodeaminase/alanine dehydrogenase